MKVLGVPSESSKSKVKGKTERVLQALYRERKEKFKYTHSPDDKHQLRLRLRQQKIKKFLSDEYEKYITHPYFLYM